MKIQHKIDLPDNVIKLSDIFKKNNYKLYLVGGSVRDSLLGLEINDYDLATDATPDQIEHMLKKLGIHTIPTGKQFGVITVVMDKEEFEIATFRSDSLTSDGRKPDYVEYTTIENDVLRRDLTTNALFYDIDNQEIVDLVNGLDDIKNGIIRTVGSPKQRFDEDNLRKIRCIRFSSILGYKIDPETSDAIKENPSLEGVSPERIREEFIKGIKKSKSVKEFIENLDEHNLLEQFFDNNYISNIPDNKLFRKLPYLLAYIIQTDSINSLDIDLNRHKYSSTETFETCFLKDVYLLAIDEKKWYTDKILKIKKKQPEVTLDKKDITLFLNLYPFISKKFIKSFEDFEPSFKENGLIEKGFIGKKLGDKIIEREMEKWNNLIYGSTNE